MRAIPCLPIILIALTLDGCRPTDAPAKAGVEKELQAFAKRIEDNLIFVEGGEFLMGGWNTPRNACPITGISTAGLCTR
jgi:hypothetical protein